MVNCFVECVALLGFVEGDGEEEVIDVDVDAHGSETGACAAVERIVCGGFVDDERAR